MQQKSRKAVGYDGAYHQISPMSGTWHTTTVSGGGVPLWIHDYGDEYSVL